MLIADDTPDVVNFLAAILGKEYRIITAVDGRRTLELAREHQPDLILLDVMMPGIDGFEICRRLRQEERTQRIPIVFLTGLTTVEDEQHALELGAIDFIVKPIQPAIVRLRVRNHMELKQYRDFLEDLSLADGLTAIGNRRRFDETLLTEWRRARRARSALGLVLLDVDFFKLFNDRYGHAMGDDCLRQVAATIAMLVRRPGDLCARYGGEEFAVILPQTDLSGVLTMGDRIRLSVKALEIPHADSNVEPVVTVSVGAASLRPTGDATPEDLVRLADKRLYDAKLAGRNCVM